MKSFKLQWSILLLCVLATFLSLETGFTEGTLLSGWILPNPSEVVIIGLFFLKIIGLQLAVAHGLLMPPHNPFFGKRSISSKPFRNQSKSTKIISIKEFQTIERVLISLRRIDGKNCFIRSVCEMNQDLLVNDGKLENKGRSNNRKLIQVFKLRQLLGITSKSFVWDVYEEATGSERMNCSKKYPDCPLTQKEIRLDMQLGTSLKTL